MTEEEKAELKRYAVAINKLPGYNTMAIDVRDVLSLLAENEALRAELAKLRHTRLTGHVDGCLCWRCDGFGP